MADMSSRARRFTLIGIPVLALALVAPLTPAASHPAAHADPGSDTATVQVLTINDFHGRIETDPWRSPGIAGAAVLSGAVAALRTEHPATIFASAGDNIGASTFTSFIAADAPAIDALTQSHLDVSAVGNHEFDRGIADLTGRVLPRFGDRTGSDGGRYGLGANVRDEATGDPLLNEYAIVERDGIKIGFIGTVTEQTATSVNPALIDGVAFTSQLAAANRVAAEIDDLVDATVLLAHDGAQSADCAAIATEQSTFGTLAREASPLIDAVVSAHTHMAYQCVIADRPVIQAGFYGAALGKLLFEFDTSGAAAVLTGVSTDLIALANSTTGETHFTPDPAVETIVSTAVAEADVLGREPVGRISADILRGGTPPGTDRSVESSLGNLIADITQQSIPGADIGMMNAGGLREDLFFLSAPPDGSGGAHPAGTVTFRDVANVQPFANTMMTVRLSGAQLGQLLEQQWTVSEGVERKRHLSVSEGFSYTYRPDAPLGSRITSMTLRGVPIDPVAHYTVATISFLAHGGDDLAVFPEGSDHTDTGRNDLQMTIDYFRAQEIAGLVVEPPALGRAIAETPAPGPGPTPGPQPGPSPTPTPDADPSPEESADPLARTGAEPPIGSLTLVIVLTLAGAALMFLGTRGRWLSLPHRS